MAEISVEARHVNFLIACDLDFLKAARSFSGAVAARASGSYLSEPAFPACSHWDDDRGRAFKDEWSD